MFEWAYDGVNSSIPRNVGPECAFYLSPKRRVLETAFVSIFIIIFWIWGFKKITLPKRLPYINQDRVGRRVLLIIMSMVLGIEIGFKFTSRTIIYLLNPCHITTAIQLFLLAAEPSPMVTSIFRMHLNLMNGPVLAFLFPETESRRIFPDKAIYYIQHGLMLVIPYYLLRIGGVYNIEPYSDLSWPMLTYGFNLAYHFWILQVIAWPTQVNLSHMLCPAVLDPFEGQNYRMYVFVHQGILCPLLSRLLCYLFDYLLTKFPLTKVKSSLEVALPRRKYENDNNKKVSNALENGHTHLD